MKNNKFMYLGAISKKNPGSKARDDILVSEKPYSEAMFMSFTMFLPSGV